jgi:SAM-dependent methyltransferase
MKTGPPSPDQPERPALTADERAAQGAALYSRRVLFFYDFFVLWFSSRLAWKCPASRVLALYNELVTSRHLEVGVGTGYFCDHCRFPSAPDLWLADLNPGPLAVAARRLARHHPHTLQLNVLEPLPFAEPAFDSIGFNHVLHCLPGSMAEKGLALRHLKGALQPGGVLFGATVLGGGVTRNPLARLLMRLYNAKGVFCNRHDTPEALEAVLRENFRGHRLEIQGCVALFSGRAESDWPGNSPGQRAESIP